MSAPVTVRWSDTDGWTFGRVYTDWLEAARILSEIDRYENLRLVSVEAPDGFAEYRARLR